MHLVRKCILLAQETKKEKERREEKRTLSCTVVLKNRGIKRGPLDPYLSYCPALVVPSKIGRREWRKLVRISRRMDERMRVLRSPLD